MKNSLFIMAISLTCLVAFTLTATAQAQTETLTATFTRPDGGTTTNLYDGTVLLNVTGVGQAGGTAYNDAFYVYTNQAGNLIPPTINPDNSLQLGYSPNTLTVYDTDAAAIFSIIGDIPAYNSSHNYSFLLNTGLTTPGRLHFGVIDGFYADNTGSYTITVTQAPEPGTFALLGLGLFGALFLNRKRFPWWYPHPNPQCVPVH